MLPIILTLALALFSFLCSAFVILRIVIPILPPHPLSRRVPPSEFGLPNFKTLSPADKSHIWLASCDIVALAVFIWQALTEYFGGPSGYATLADPASSARLWLATTLRQTCLLVVAGLTLAHVRMGQSVTFGKLHWMLWVPTLLLTVVSTAIASTLAGAGMQSLFWGLLGYSTSLAVLSSLAFACLVGTLIIINKNLATLHDIRDPWPPVKPESEKPRPSFDTADVDGLKEGSSWITSQASSRRDSISAFSFSTHHTSHSRVQSNSSSRLYAKPALASNASIALKSSYWFNPGTPGNGLISPVPPVPPLPAPYGTATPRSYNVDNDPDPFRSPDFRPRLDSQSSWLTEPSVYQPTLSAWSFTPSSPGSPCPSAPGSPLALLRSDSTMSRLVPAMVSTDVLGGYAYAQELSCTEIGAGSTNPSPVNEVDVSIYRTVGWLITIWVPMVLALPYYVTIHPQIPVASGWSACLLIVSVSVSSPLLALNILLRSPLPIPSGLFDTPADPPSIVLRAPSPCSTFVHEYKRSAGSATVVEGRRSGDVWLAKGDAVDGKGKVARAVGLLHPKPKLVVLPPEETQRKDDLPSPPLPMQDADHHDQYTAPSTPQSVHPGDMGFREGTSQRKKDSKASSYWSGTDDSTALATQIMIAQRHYSALAMTMVLPPSPVRQKPQDALAEEGEAASSTAVEAIEAETAKPSRHLRARSVSSLTSVPWSAVSGPPSTPLPPTPPTLKNLRSASAGRRNAHRISFSSYSSSADEFSFGPIDKDDVTEIDALSAGLLPLLLPGITIGGDMKIARGWKGTPSLTSGDGAVRKSEVPLELGGVSSEIPSSITLENMQGTTRTSAHKRHHFSLPSLETEGAQAMEDELSLYNSTPVHVRRNTAHCGERSDTYLNALRKEEEPSRSTSLGISSPQSLFYFPDILNVPEGIDTNRNSLSTLISALDQELKMTPVSAASDITLFDFDPDFDGAERSTPHESKIQPRRSEEVPPTPEPPLITPRHSSISYIKSGEDAVAELSHTSCSDPVAQRAIRPLIPKPKTHKLQRKASKFDDQENVPSVTARPGLRPLSLLQNRALHRDGATTQGTKPLTINRKGKNKKSGRLDSENVCPESSLRQNLRPLKLARNDTTKERAVLRDREVIPSVVIRPPSTTFRS